MNENDNEAAKPSDTTNQNSPSKGVSFEARNIVVAPVADDNDEDIMNDNEYQISMKDFDKVKNDKKMADFSTFLQDKIKDVLQNGKSHTYQKTLREKYFLRKNTADEHAEEPTLQRVGTIDIRRQFRKSMHEQFIDEDNMLILPDKLSDSVIDDLSK